MIQQFLAGAAGHGQLGRPLIGPDRLRRLRPEAAIDAAGVEAVDRQFTLNPLDHGGLGRLDRPPKPGFPP